MKTRDIDIRRNLHYKLSSDHKNEENTLIIDEMAICQGDSRIDIAVINGSLNGYEIKSESDTLERLPKQMEFYNRVFDTVTILTSPNYIDEIIDMVPKWWGVIYTEMDTDGNVYFCNVREAEQNNVIDPLSVAQLLWRDEALDILKEKGLQKGLLSKPRRILWDALAESVPLVDLCESVRQKLKLRSNWRVH